MAIIALNGFDNKCILSGNPKLRDHHLHLRKFVPMIQTVEEPSGRQVINPQEKCNVNKYLEILHFNSLILIFNIYIYVVKYLFPKLTGH